MISVLPEKPNSKRSLIGFILGLLILLATLGTGILTAFTPAFGLPTTLYNSLLLSGTGIGTGILLYTMTRLSNMNISVSSIRLFVIGHFSIVFLFIVTLITSPVHFEHLFISLVVLTAIESTLLHIPVLQSLPKQVS